ncbi:hypothetical protein BO71DRAFT_94345 [Aspergillus ellipticus CBS 707.79]|uniref:Uncharacterized protein n=1 Tax=Aspergillus ellipticus CBS 707.79 TaxID=1448320 RepID=A0A319EG61_9EURO|nr:hypothetical protein BO71DRAFT_94345 [Aspergillus ellipticus CBS 707.79]
MASMEFPLFPLSTDCEALRPIPTGHGGNRPSEFRRTQVGKGDLRADLRGLVFPLWVSSRQQPRGHFDPRRHARFIRFMSIRMDSLHSGSTMGDSDGVPHLLGRFPVPGRASSLCTRGAAASASLLRDSLLNNLEHTYLPSIPEAVGSGFQSIDVPHGNLLDVLDCLR